VAGWRSAWRRTGPAFEHPLEMAAVVVAVVTLTGVALWAWRRLRSADGG